MVFICIDLSETIRISPLLFSQWHPDKNPGDETATKNFQKISEAFSTLNDPKKRKLYDQYGVEGANAADHINENDIPTGAGFRGRGGGAGVHHMSPEEAQAFFGQFFGGSGEAFFL
jgi:DnaJ-class molecular chaperone